MANLIFLMLLLLVLLPVCFAAPVKHITVDNEDRISFDGLQNTARKDNGLNTGHISATYPILGDELSDIAHMSSYGHAWEAHRVSDSSQDSVEHLKPVIRYGSQGVTEPVVADYPVSGYSWKNHHKPASDSIWETDSVTGVDERDFYHHLSMSALRMVSPTIRQDHLGHSHPIISHTGTGHADFGTEAAHSDHIHHDHHSDHNDQHDHSHSSDSDDHADAPSSGTHAAHDHHAPSAHSKHPTLADIKFGNLKTLPYELTHTHFKSFSHDHDKPTIPFSKSDLSHVHEHSEFHKHEFPSSFIKEPTTSSSHGHEHSVTTETSSITTAHAHGDHEASAINGATSAHAPSQHPVTSKASDTTSNPHPHAHVHHEPSVVNGATNAYAPSHHPVTSSTDSVATENPHPHVDNEHSVSNGAVSADESSEFAPHVHGESDQAHIHGDHHVLEKTGSTEAPPVADHTHSVPHIHETNDVPTASVSNSRHHAHDSPDHIDDLEHSHSELGQIHEDAHV